MVANLNVPCVVMLVAVTHCEPLHRCNLTVRFAEVPILPVIVTF